MVSGKAGKRTQESGSRVWALICYAVIFDSSLFSLSFPHLRSTTQKKKERRRGREGGREERKRSRQHFYFHSYPIVFKTDFSSLRYQRHLTFGFAQKQSWECRSIWEAWAKGKQGRRHGRKQPIQRPLSSQRPPGWLQLHPSDKPWEIVQSTGLRVTLPHRQGSWNVYTLTPGSHWFRGVAVLDRGHFFLLAAKLSSFRERSSQAQMPILPVRGY